ncbi:unnamed protein product [Victoria cruziana]
MEYNAAIQMSRPGYAAPTAMADSSQFPRTRSQDDRTGGIESAMWQMSLRSSEIAESGSYPERPGEQDCAYYMRTGLCRFGMTCRFNHPPNRKLAVAAARMKGGYPERIGQPDCQYYLKTGTCKFGSTCKFHHPRDKAGVAGRILLNVFGYPLRPNEKECAYYLRTGQCKYGGTCKFHHPQPISLRGSAIYSPIHSPTTAGQQSYPSGLANWPLSRTPFVASPRWQGPASYAQLILPQGVVPVPGWNTYTVSPIFFIYNNNAIILILYDHHYYSIVMLSMFTVLFCSFHGHDEA